MARLAISRPGFPKMSPMNRIRTSDHPHGNAALTTAPFLDPRQRDAELSRAQGRLGPPGVEGPREPHASREAAERPFGDMERGLALMRAFRRMLVTHDEQRVARHDDLHAVRADTGHVHDHLDPVRLFDHVKRHGAFGRRRRRVVGARQSIEKPAELIIHLTPFEKNAGHVCILSRGFLFVLRKPPRLALDCAKISFYTAY